MQKKIKLPITESVVIKTPFSKLELVFESGVLVGVDLFSRKTLLVAQSDEARDACQQVNDYCSKKLFEFNIDLKTNGSLFQRKVWRALREIPAGNVLTYGELAQQLKTSARAVGNACRANPLPLVIPCHRVVAKTGLGGFAGSQVGTPMKIKRWLLEHEGVSV